jgi:hypothetical protein
MQMVPPVMMMRTRDSGYWTMEFARLGWLRSAIVPDALQDSCRWPLSTTCQLNSSKRQKSSQ